MASQSIYVDLDLKNNKIQNVAKAVGAYDVPNLDQVADLISGAVTEATHPAATAGTGITNNLTPTAQVISVNLVPAGGLGADTGGIYVDVGTGLSRSADGVAVNIGTGLADVNDDVAVDQAWLATFVADNAANNIEAGGGIGISVGTGTDGADVISADVSDTAGNSLTVDAGGLFVPTPAATDLSGYYTKTEVDASQGAQDALISANTTAIGVNAGNITANANAIAAETTARTDADALKADKAVTVTASGGLTGGGTLAGPDVPLSIADGGVTAAKLATDSVTDLAVAAHIWSLVDVTRVGTENAPAGQVLTSDGTNWVAQPISVSNLPSLGGDLTGTLTAAQIAPGAIVDADVSGTADIAQSKIAGLTASLTGLQGEIDAEELARAGADTTLQGNIDAEAATRAADDATLQGNIDAEVTRATAAEGLIDARVSAISIVGSGVATTSETGDNQWTITVPSVQLAETYTGPGTESVSINADLADAGRPGGAVTPSTGDLYINNTAGTAFLNSGLAAPDDWVELAPAEVGIDSITAGSGIEVSGGQGPAATVSVAAATLAEISTATSTNTAQDTAISGLDGRIDTLEAASHAAATGVDAIAVSGTQAVSLVVDPTSTSGILSQSGTGLKADLSAYTPTAGVAALAPIQSVAGDANVSAVTTAGAVGLGLTTTFTDRITAIEAVNTQQNTSIGDLQLTDTELQADIDAEVLARGGADTTLQGNITAEATARADADTDLQAQIDTKATKGEIALNIAAGGTQDISAVPAGATFTVVDSAGCVATIGICNRTASANQAFTGTLFWTGVPAAV